MRHSMTLAMALIALMAVLAACSNDYVVEETKPTITPEKTYTVTISAAKGEDNTWATSEKVYVMKPVAANNENTQYVPTWANGSLQPQADGAQTTLQGTISGFDIVAGDVLTLQFPRPNDISYTSQDGTLKTIASTYNYATASITVASVDENGNITPTESSVTFETQQAIVRFTLFDNTGKPINPTRFVIGPVITSVMYQNDGSIVNENPKDLTIFPNGESNVVYAALRGVDDNNILLTATVGGDTYTFSKSGMTFTHGQFYDIELKMEHEGKTLDLNGNSGKVILRDNDTATGQMDNNGCLAIEDGATVTLNSVKINIDGSDPRAGIECLGSATIVLGGESTICVGNTNTYPAVYVPENGTLTIQGNGKLRAESDESNSAGIGGGVYTAGGNIVIVGGTIEARGGYDSAGIGSSKGGRCGNIVISGGNVTATGKGNSAGIGCGTNATCGDITITDGINVVRSVMGEFGIYRIGGVEGNRGTVTIDDVEMTNQWLYSGYNEFPNLNSVITNDSWTLSPKTE